MAHIPAYKAMGDKVKIVAVADIREEAAKETAERHGIPKYYVCLLYTSFPDQRAVPSVH